MNGKTKLTLVAVLAAAWVGALSSCGGNKAPAGDGKIDVFVSILPQKYFVQRIGGDLVEVHVLVGPGQSPETYEPTARQVTELARARIYFRIGMPFENALTGKMASAFKGLEIVDTRKGVPLRELTGPGEEAHGDESGADPHIWLSPELVKIQAATIRDALRRYDPEQAPTYDENYVIFARELDSVDAEIRRILAPYKGEKMYVFHPAYGYFAAAYGLVEEPIEAEGKEPSAKELQQLIAAIGRGTNRTIFVQPQFSEKTARTIATAIGGKIVPLDPLAEDYLNNLIVMAHEIAQALPSPGAALSPDTSGERSREK